MQAVVAKLEDLVQQRLLDNHRVRICRDPLNDYNSIEVELEDANKAINKVSVNYITVRYEKYHEQALEWFQWTPATDKNVTEQLTVDNLNDLLRTSFTRPGQTQVRFKVHYVSIMPILNEACQKFLSVVPNGFISCTDTTMRELAQN